MKIEFEINVRRVLMPAVGGLLGLFVLHAAFPGLYSFWPRDSQDLAAWVQAIGSIAAILVAVGLSYFQAKDADTRDERRRQEERRLQRAQVTNWINTLGGTLSAAKIGLLDRQNNDLTYLRMFRAQLMAELESGTRVPLHHVSEDEHQHLYRLRLIGTNMLIAVELAERHGLEHMNTVEVEHFKVLTRSIDERKRQIEHVLADLSVQPDGSGFPHRAAPPLQ